MAQPTPERQIEFLTNLQRLLSEGLFVATYKYALLMAPADLCVERGQDDDERLALPTRLIADKFVQYYWRQSMPFVPQADPAQEQVLRQNSGKQAGIIRLIVEARRRYDGSIADAGRDERNWRALVGEVDAVVRVMPLWKLQTVGGERLDFLYDNTGTGTSIVLKPCVDLGHNFVLAHATCNSQKSDRLAGSAHLNAWAAQAERSAPEMARKYDRTVALIAADRMQREDAFKA